MEVCLSKRLRTVFNSRFFKQCTTPCLATLVVWSLCQTFTYYNLFHNNGIKMLFNTCLNFQAFTASSCTICTNLYLFPVTVHGDILRTNNLLDQV